MKQEQRQLLKVYNHIHPESFNRCISFLVSLTLPRKPACASLLDLRAFQTLRTTQSSEAKYLQSGWTKYRKTFDFNCIEWNSTYKLKVSFQLGSSEFFTVDVE